MSEPAYSLEAWRRLTEPKQNPCQQEPECSEVPGDAAADKGPPASIFDGKRYTPEEWIWHHCVPKDPVKARPEPDDKCPVHWADCGGTRVWIVRDGERWLMYAGSRRPGSRKTDFASPFLTHAMQTAECWYGPPHDGWHAEEDLAKGSR